MNDFLSLAQKRYAVRSYLPKPVEAEKLERILEAGSSNGEKYPAVQVPRRAAP